MTTVTDPPDNVSTVSHDALNHIASWPDFAGNTTQYEYDPTGSLAKMASAAGGETTVTLPRRQERHGGTWYGKK